MIARIKRTRRRDEVPAWHEKFLAMLPTIIGQARFAFSRLPSSTQEEAVQEVVAQRHGRFRQAGRAGSGGHRIPTVLARFGIAQYRSGRRVGSQMNGNDLTSEYAQHKKGFTVSRLDHQDRETGAWKEAVIEDRRTPVPDQVAFRLDFPAWLKTHSRRNRRIAEQLAMGETTQAVARRFKGLRRADQPTSP